MNRLVPIFFFLLTFLILSCKSSEVGNTQPNIILVMSDDQGWGQVGYYDHPILKTPNLDQMAQKGLRLDRFYAGAPVCSPTRASVLTGRANDRSAVYSHGYPLRIQEKTIAQALQRSGYHTAHFGKWHLNGLKGPGVPVFKEDERSPSVFGFEEWITVTNFFDINPLMGSNGEVKEYRGSSSEIIVDQALDYIAKNKEHPFFVVIWYGSPHDPWHALEGDKEELPTDLDSSTRNYLGEIVEIDRSIGKLRNGLKAMALTNNTLLWFNSDNGGLPQGDKEGVGGLRGFKGSVYEGGLRVPCIIEWPDHIEEGQTTNYPASTMDIFPTIASILGLPDDAMTYPVDGASIAHVFNDEVHKREKPIPFKFNNKGALISNDYKLVVEDIEQRQYALYNINEDKDESHDILSIEQKVGTEMINYYESWLESVHRSVEGNDYPEGLKVPDPEDIFWWDAPEYIPYIEQWKDRPEYNSRLKRAEKI